MLTNNTDLSLPLQVFLAHNEYDQVPGDDYISATAILKPLKAIILGMRASGKDMDVIDLVASAMGTAAHTRLEAAFSDGNHIVNMRKLGVSQDAIDKTRINPTKVEDHHYPIYMEKRTIKPLDSWRIGGKFDFLLDGAVRDLKTTKVFSYIKGDFEDYKMQLSIYRWLNPNIITEDWGYIDFLFTDWKEFEVTKENYPPYPALSVKIQLMSIADTERWLREKLRKIEFYKDKVQQEIPDCSNKELWQDAPKYAYFKKPEAKKATKLFNSYAEAHTRLLLDGSTGKIDTRLGKPKRCNYCIKADCQQAQEFILQGVLEM